MKRLRIFTSIAIVFISTSLCKAQNEIKPEDAAKHMGDSVRVCSVVLEGKYLQQAKDAPTRLFMGSRQPDPDLTIVIPKDVKLRMKYDPEKKLVNKHVCVTGKISSYEGRPAIYVYNENNIEDLDDK